MSHVADAMLKRVDGRLGQGREKTTLEDRVAFAFSASGRILAKGSQLYVGRKYGTRPEYVHMRDAAAGRSVRFGCSTLRAGRRVGRSISVLRLRYGSPARVRPIAGSPAENSFSQIVAHHARSVCTKLFLVRHAWSADILRESRVDSGYV